MPWWGWLLITLGSIVGMYILVAGIFFMIVGAAIWKSWKNW